MHRPRESITTAVAVSEFNAGELRSLGFRNVVVSPLVVDTDALKSVRSDKTMADYLSCFEGPVFLFVGQMLPHKRPDWLLSAYHALVTYLEPKAATTFCSSGMAWS